MARLTAAEFDDLIAELTAAQGLGKLQGKLLQSRAIVSRRRLGTTEALSRQLFQLTLGLDREGLVTQVVLALWEEHLSSKLDETITKELEALAETINACLSPRLEVDSAREGDLRAALEQYRSKLGGRVGERASYVTMLMRAVPAVAGRIRALRSSLEAAPARES